jgi:hypothetical protein
MVRVPVPTPVYCNPPEIQRPELPIAHLTLASPPADTIRLYAATVEVLKGAVMQRDTIIDGCRGEPDSGDPGKQR